jgi:hypothetical protein
MAKAAEPAAIVVIHARVSVVSTAMATTMTMTMTMTMSVTMAMIKIVNLTKTLKARVWMAKGLSRTAKAQTMVRAASPQTYDQAFFFFSCD